MSIEKSNKNPFNHSIENLKPNFDYTIKIVRTIIGNSEADSMRGGEVVQLVETITTMTIGRST